METKQSSFSGFEQRSKDQVSFLLDDVLGKIPQAFLMVDAELNLIYINDSATSLFNISFPELNTSIWQNIPVLETVGKKYFTRALEEQRSISYDDVCPVSGIWFSCKIHPFKNGLSVFIQDISTSKRMEDQLRFHNGISDYISDATITIDNDFMVISWNAAAERIYGWKSEDVIGFYLPKVLHTEYLTDGNRQFVLDKIEQVGYWSGEVKQKKRNGEWMYLSSSISSIKDNKGNQLGFVIVNKDISEQYKVQQELKTTESYFRTISQTIPQLVWIAASDGKMSWFNKKWYEFTGLQEGDKYPEGLWEMLVHPDDLQSATKRWNTCFYSSVPYSNEYRLRDIQGNYRWFLSRGLPLKDHDGKIISWFGTCTDIQESKEASNEIERLHILNSRQADLLKTLMGATPDIVVMLDDTFRFTYVNQAGVRIFGVQLYDLLLKTPFDLNLSQQTNDHLKAGLEEAKKTKKLTRFEMPFFTSQGERHFDVILNPVVQDEKLQYMVGVVRDITNRKQEEIKLKQSEEKFRRLVESIDDYVFITDQRGRVQDIFGGWSRKNPAKLKQIVGKTPEQLYDSETANVHKFAFEQALKGEKHSYEWTLNRNGKEYRYQTFVSPIFGNSVVEGIVGLARDITNSWELERRKDEFISIASHELKTPVTSIKIYNQIIQQFGKDLSPDVKNYLSKMENQINKLTGLISELLDVSKIQAGRISYCIDTFDADVFIKDILDNLSRNYPSHKIELSGTVGKALNADKTRIGQVIENLVSNAVKYSPKADKVSVIIKNEKDNFLVSVRDYGIGIPNEHFKKLFERFYRIQGTKEGHFPGMGIGLYISNEIVKHHGGQFHVESIPGKGSIFSFRIPFNQ